MKIELIAIDLDDTLLREDLTISEVNLAALRDAEAAGIRIVLASGRNFKSMKRYVDLIGLKKKGDYLVCSNGAETMEADTGLMLDRLMLTPELCREASAAIEAEGFPWQVYVGGRILCSEINPWAEKDGYLTGQSIGLAGDRAELFAEGQIKFVIPGEPQRIQPLLVKLGRIFEGRAEVLTSKPYFLEILPLGADKGDALERLTGRLGIKMADTMAIGDAMNDMGMIRKAGWGCAPANAIAPVKAAARIVSELTNEEDAVASLIRSVALQPR